MSNCQTDDYKTNLIAKAEQLITQGFPDKIVELNQLLETPMFKVTDFEDIYQEVDIPIPAPNSRMLVHLVDDGVDSDEDDASVAKRKFTSCFVPGFRSIALPVSPVACNAPLSKMIEVVKPIIRKLVEDSNILKMWICFMIPKVEDGNNFGVSIQAETLAEIQAVESGAEAFFDQISRYFLSRGKLIAEVTKYPHVKDYRRAVMELDEKEYFSLWIGVSEARNRYLLLHDIVIKNLEKLTKPRSSHTESLY